MNLHFTAAFLLYAVILFAISFLFYRRMRNASAFMIGNRSLNYWVTAISAQASDMSTWLFLGYPAEVYSCGAIEIWTAVGLVSFMYITWRVIAPTIRRATEEYQALTLWTYFERKYNDTRGIIGILCTVIATLFFIVYIAAGLVSLGRIFESMYGITYTSGILISIVLTCAYILIGGFLAVAWANLFQGLFLLAMILLVPIAAYFYLPSASIISQMAAAKGVSLAIAPSFKSLISAILLAAGWGLGYFGQPHVIVNFMAIDDANNIVYARKVGVIWQILALTAAFAIGILGIGMYGSSLARPEDLFITMITDLFPSFIVGMVLCGVFAAALASVNGKLLVTASSLSENIWCRLVPTRPSSSQLLWVSRTAIVVVGALSTLLALWTNETIYHLVHYAWSGLGSAFGPLMMLSLYSTCINKHGALAAIVTGGVIGLGWSQLGTVVPTLVAGFVLSSLMAYAVSAITRQAE